MSITHHTTDILTHIATDTSLSAKVSSIGGCITIITIGIASLEGCYAFSGDTIKVSAVLKTPLGNVELGSAILDTKNPKITLGGSIDGFKAEASFAFDFNKLILEICGKACAPFAGCVEGCTAIHV
jgi:hypothetical protein